MQPWHLDMNRKVDNMLFMISRKQGKDETKCWVKYDKRNALRNQATNPPLDQKSTTIFGGF